MILDLVIQEEHTSEDDNGRGYQLGEPSTQSLSETIFDGYPRGEATLKETLGDLFRHSRREYGRCMSRIYVDDRQGKTHPVGWYFEKRRPFDDDPRKSYRHGVWITLRQRINGALVPFYFDQPERLIGC